MADGRATELWDLIGGAVQDVEVWCNACGHHGVVATRGLIDRFGSHHLVGAVAARCRCRRCGSKDLDSRPDWRDRGPGVVTRHTPDEDRG